MRRLLIFMSLILLLCGCQKLETRMQGKFYTDTVDGMLYLELLAGDGCVAYFSGGEEDGGYWHVLEDNVISVTVSPEIKKSSSIVQYWISGRGKIINADSFSVSATRSRYSWTTDKEEKTLYFKRR